jgi:hypothetical protein
MENQCVVELLEKQRRPRQPDFKLCVDSEVPVICNVFVLLRVYVCTMF